MKQNKGKLYAIYKNGEHKGNERGKSKNEAIKAYIIASDLGHFLNDENFIRQYSAKIAINGVHYHFINQ